MDPKDRLWIQFENTGLHIDKIENFDDSYHKLVYRTALQKIEEIIENFDKNKTNELINILSFIGERGSGKSSVMKSFIDAMEDLKWNSYNRNQSGEYIKYFQDHLVSFTCLDYIDGALLEQGEDIVSLVLAQIYQKFVDVEQTRGMYVQEDYEYKKREFLKKLEKVYRTVCEIQAMNCSEGIQNVGAISYLSKLDSLASSQKLKKEFQDLIYEFTDWMQYYETSRIDRKVNHYLVIAIDDIDLNIENGFSMLEKVHRYLTVKNVIVVVSVDYQQMHKLAVRHFYQMYPPVDAVLRNGAAYAARVATDYLDKILPMNYRVYMSDINDLYVSEQTGISHEQAGIKETILGKIYRRTGIGFDTQGMKPHFYVRGSLRHINNLYLFLEKMNSADLQELYMHQQGEVLDSQNWGNIERNWNLMLQDLMNRMAVDKLSVYPGISEDKGETTYMGGLYSNAEQFLNTIVAMDLNRAKEEVVMLSQKLSWKKSLFETFEEEYSEDLPEEFINEILKEPMKEMIERCSYGDLVEAIYNLGRLENNQYKPLVHCLLAYFSYMFTREYLLEIRQSALSDGDQIVKTEYIKKLINGSIVEEWGKKLLPAVRRVNEMSTDVEEHGIKNVINSEDRSYIGNKKGISLRKALRFNFTDLEMNSIDDVVEFICSIEVLYTLFSDIPSTQYTQEELIEGLNFSLEEGRYGFYWFDVDFGVKENTESDVIRKNLEEGEIAFNILNFAANFSDMSERLTLIEEKLVNVMAPYCMNVIEHSPENKLLFKKNITDRLRRNSIRQAYDNWKMRYGKNAMPFPLQWFDMSYNILKRTKRYAESKFPDNIHQDELDKLFDYMKDIYKYMSQELQKQYETLHTEKSGGYNFAEQFMFFPIIRYFMENNIQYTDETIPEKRKKVRRHVWKKFFENIISDENPESREFLW